MNEDKNYRWMMSRLIHYKFMCFCNRFAHPCYSVEFRRYANTAFRRIPTCDRKRKDTSHQNAYGQYHSKSTILHFSSGAHSTPVICWLAIRAKAGKESRWVLSLSHKLIHALFGLFVSVEFLLTIYITRNNLANNVFTQWL